MTENVKLLQPGDVENDTFWMLPTVVVRFCHDCGEKTNHERWRSADFYVCQRKHDPPRTHIKDIPPGRGGLIDR